MKLARFQADWKHHNPLQPEQLEHAAVVATVRELSYYHGGDVLYRLENLPVVAPLNEPIDARRRNERSSRQRRRNP
jgi:hypothetical protein